LDFQKNIALLIAITAIFSGLLGPVLSFDFAFATSEEEERDNGDDGGGGGDEPEADPGFAGDPGPEPPIDPCEENQEAEGCAPEPPVDPCKENPEAEECMPPDPCVEDPTAERCEPPVCSCPPGEGKDCPDIDCHPCIEDPSLPECEPLPPPDGDCHPSYPDTCIPPPPPNLNCDDISFRNFKVIGSDPHGFDGYNDDIGCEGSGRGGDGSNGDSDGDNDEVSTSANECQGQADCFRGTVTEIVDRDTIDINNMRVRLALVNTPERGENGYTEAIDFVESACGVGTKALVDEDDGQKEGSFDRLIGLVYCGDDDIYNKKSLNELLLEGAYAVIYQDFCNISEFSSVSAAQRHGC
jgi:endonuclease YncB( thermonuclease family)